MLNLKYRNSIDAKPPDTHLEARGKPNCQEGAIAFWEKRQCFGTQSATYPVLLTRGQRGKPVVLPIQRAEEVLKRVINQHAGARGQPHTIVFSTSFASNSVVSVCSYGFALRCVFNSPLASFYENIY